MGAVLSVLAFLVLVVVIGLLLHSSDPYTVDQVKRDIARERKAFGLDRPIPDEKEEE
jgi:hypothetical protein